MAAIGVQVGTGLIDLEIKGMTEIERNLKVLRETFGVKTGGVINRGLMRGARLIRDEARSNAPVLGGESTSKQYRAFKARAKHRAGTALSAAENQRVPGNIKHNIVAHYVKNLPLTVWVRVRSRTYIFAERKSRTLSKRWGMRGGADPSNLVGNPNYWWLVEFGARGRPGRAFMRRAFESKKVDAARLAAATMRAEIEALGRGFGLANAAQFGLRLAA